LIDRFSSLGSGLRVGIFPALKNNIDKISIAMTVDFARLLRERFYRLLRYADAASMLVYCCRNAWAWQQPVLLSVIGNLSRISHG
jgi:hypothetical protein